MAAQTTYTQDAAKALPGLVAYGYGPNEIVSKKAEGAFNFGLVVVRGTSDTQVKLNGTVQFGVSVRDIHRENTSTPATLYQDEDVAAIMKRGYIWATIADAGVPGNALNFVNATGVIGVGTAVAGETDLTGWTLETTVGAGELGLIRVAE